MVLVEEMVVVLLGRIFWHVQALGRSSVAQSGASLKLYSPKFLRSLYLELIKKI